MLPHSLPAVRSQDDLVASRLEDFLKECPDVRFVVYDKDSRHWLISNMPAHSNPVNRQLWPRSRSNHSNWPMGRFRVGHQSVEPSAQIRSGLCQLWPWSPAPVRARLRHVEAD